MRALLAKLENVSPAAWAVILGAVIAAIYLASIAACGPWDPWETHYGEVARNIVARKDPMDLWWRPGYGPQGKREGVFASKHALPFWCMALSFKLFGVGTGGLDEMVRGPVPELALRLPSLIVGLGTVAFIARCVARLVDWRAGLLVAVALASMPQYAIVTRQAVTDIYFVGPVCLAMMAWVMAWSQAERELRTRGRGWREVPWDRAWLGFLLVFALGAILPLAILHLHVVDEDTILRVARWKRKTTATVTDLETISRHFIGYWALVAIILVRSLRWRRRSQTWMGVVYVAGGLSLMGKGMIGPGIIGLLILVHMLVSGRLHLLWQARCELAIGILIFVVSCFPWHHAMAIFRGERWVNELIVVNNLERFASGEQDQAVGGFAFYLRTLGLAALPWSAVVPPALWAALQAFRRGRRVAELESDRDEERARDASGLPLDSEGELRRFALLWFIVSFGLITYSVTKYYHYLVPCLPPLAIVVGVWLRGLLVQAPASQRDTDTETDTDTPSSSSSPSPSPSPCDGAGPGGRGLPQAAVLCCALAGCAILFMVTRAAVEEPAWLAHLTTYLYTGMWREGAAATDRLAWCVVPFGVGLLVWIARRQRAAVAAMVFSGLLTTTYVIDDYLPATSENWSQRTAFRYLFDHLEENDRVLSWWFYYRGETYFTKQRIWVSMEPNRKELRAYVDKHRGKGATFWVMTTSRHAERAKSHFPADMRDTIEVVYRNFHYALIKVEVP